MRYGIFSDVHSNLEALTAVLRAYEKEQIDRFMCVGDIVGYAADPAECIRRVRGLADPVLAGNHDWAVAGRYPIDRFNSYAAQAVQWTNLALEEGDLEYLSSLQLVYRQEGIILVHGTLCAPENFDYLSELSEAEATLEGCAAGEICFVGHTHVAQIIIQGEDGRIGYAPGTTVTVSRKSKYIVNVGSVGQPRDRNPEAAYCIYDTQTSHITIKRVPYDIRAAQQKIVDAGLPSFLGERLRSGL